MTDNQQPDTFDRLWAEAVERHIAGLSDTDFQALVVRARLRAAAAVRRSVGLRGGGSGLGRSAG